MKNLNCELDTFEDQPNQLEANSEGHASAAGYITISQFDGSLQRLVVENPEMDGRLVRMLEQAKVLSE